MNDVTRANSAALHAIALRDWAEDASHRGFLQAGVRECLETIADAVVIDAQLGIYHASEPRKRTGERPIT